MAAVAGERSQAHSSRKHDRGMAALVQSPAVVAALLSGVLAVVVAWIGPRLAHNLELQNHEKALEIRTDLATDMSKSYTVAIGTAQQLASGLINGPTGDRQRNAAAVQAAYNTGLGQWLIDGSRVAAELSASYRGNAIIHQWRRYRLAVTRFYRLSAALPSFERRHLVRYVRSYLNEMEAVAWAAPAVGGNFDWRALKQTKRFRKSASYRRTYDRVSAALLSLGDAFVEQTVALHPEL